MRKSFFRIMAAGLILTVGFTVFTGCGSNKSSDSAVEQSDKSDKKSKNTIDLSKYIDFTVNGYSGIATARATVNKEKIQADYKDIKVNTKTDIYKLYSGESSSEIFSDMFGGGLDKLTNCSNGDTLTYTVEPAEEFADLFPDYSIKDSKITYIVSGLKEVEMFDAFADITLEIDTESLSYPLVRVNKPKDDDMWKAIQVTSRNKKGGFQSDIADGDTYVITLIYGDADKFIEKYGKLPKETEKEYIIHF